ncbi:Phosphoribosylformylglycinamidine synthase, synthetase subunit [Methanosarcina barkeri str. Wiesmoor]|uniref:Phosphoribosylformylglycinamidine synthase subunit PurL n=2 Tax=Methanosarcina barkeri TaxID=2208 RepID=PURL_METBF|nr:phosphoribosylformylglycinamidine synthase subunit PurL [Methanosarcina barkeri]Q46F25.1 RecName: Full=Phosphoribosylformylglycinamidine synthase subunit PurL; Short=FGAM synthase; AltName: Full=Formylglycinamide ribonucleotide amidotransferase subunit II; Short=FGAR amidotransferase II; Short=FGAR-AT II; AltName: Full=Glutamine amidotransferase PurL; AltName: Full=Phosphoribosylformylglycinamidine synthase subunit II [Methanosarcina barkeri str. Fusaro]AKB49722.1 Phosphoribosylformylglycinami
MLPEEDLKIIKKELGREPTLVEQGCFLNLWSEHCSYRSSAPLLKTFTSKGENVIIGPGDDAAIIKFDDGYVLAIGMESHNHPSYVDPYNGAATGIGGIVRDIISMGARPIALMDPLYFGPLDTPKNMFLFEQIIKGIAGYGNCIGVPVVNGETFFDRRYSGNPLVNVVAVGLCREEEVITARSQKAGNKLVLAGSSTGKDGLGGASFASRDLSESAEAEDRPSVQVGDPYTEKLVIEMTLEAMEKGYIKSCKDLGAAGLGGASAELAAKGGLGAHITADAVTQREPNMNAYEILLAESQERMVFEVAPEDVDAVLALVAKYDLNGAVVGYLTEKPNYTVEFKGEVVVDIPIDFLTGGAPTCEKSSVAPIPQVEEGKAPKTPEDLKAAFLKVISSYNIASKEWIYRQYDHEVQLRTVIKPGEDAGVLKITDKKGLVLSCGCQPRATLLDPYNGGKNVVIENAMNLAVKGADGLAIVNCLNFGNPDRPEIYWQLKNSVLGLGDGARELSIPVVGGNVSLYNESDEFKTAILPTPSIGIIGKVNFETPLPSSFFAKSGDAIILVGETTADMGGSEYYACFEALNAGKVPSVPKNAPEIIKAVIEAARSGKLSSAHDLSLGGIAAGLARMCRNSGAKVDLSEVSELKAEELLFSEAPARALLATSEPEAVLEILKDVPHMVIGKVEGNSLEVKGKDFEISLSLKEISDAYSSLTRFMMR